MFNVLFQARGNILNLRGGDTVQLENTIKHLNDMGVKCIFDYSYKIDCSEFDIVHLFNITSPEETFLQLQNAKRQNKPVCISPIYWNMENLEKENKKYEVKTPYLKIKYNSIKNKSKWFIDSCQKIKYDFNYIYNKSKLDTIQADILKNVDMILPNSCMELEMIQKDFPFTVNKKSHVVFNGYDGILFTSNNIDRNYALKYNLKHYVLCVGRIEPRKNQLGLIKSLRNTDIPVLCVGRHTNINYSSKVKSFMKQSDRIIEEIPHEELTSIYAGAKVHVLPSFYDTPGLVSLEAGAMGCNLVTSRIGSQEEYFGDLVDYCNPYDEDDIKMAVYNALERIWPNENISQHISNKYKWEICARQTFHAYKDLIS